MSDQYASLGEARGSSASIRDIGQPLFEAKGWMKLVGIIFIVQGVFTALTIIGILIAWLPIWIGVLLMQSAGAIERAQISGDTCAMREALTKLKTYFVIQGVLYLIGIAFMVLYFIFFGAMFAAMLKSGTFLHH